MKGKVLFIVTLLSVLFMGRAEAQRCLPKMRGIELKAGLNEADGYVLGATLSSYAKGGNKWVYGVEYLKTSHPYRTKSIPAAQFTAEGGYYYNFLSDAKKVVFFYAGVSALAGYETVNWGEKTLYDGARLNNKDAFVYGCAATLEGAFPLGRQHGRVPHGVRDWREIHHQLTDAYGHRSDESQAALGNLQTSLHCARLH